jgi:hypothetical protein
MSFITTSHHTIVQKHKILYIFKIIKFVFLLGVLMVLGWIAHRNKDEILTLHPTIMYFVIIPMLFVCLNYVFVKFILETVVYFHDLVIFYKDKIIIIKNSLFLQSDFEIIDVYRIQKLNITCHGIFANIFWYGNISIEQQNDDVKIIHFVPRPEKIVELLEIRRSTIISERGKPEKDKEENYWDRT